MDKVLPYGRRQQVLRLLAKHGPLSRRGQSPLVAPQISERRLREVLKRLQDNALIVFRRDRSFKHTGIYYQIDQGLKARTRIGKLLNVSPDSLHQPHFRQAELIHSERCALWTELLTLILPDSRILRDFEFATGPKVAEVLLTRNDATELLPDMILLLPHRTTKGSVSVAVEIERTQKGSKRLLTKL